MYTYRTGLVQICPDPRWNHLMQSDSEAGIALGHSNVAMQTIGLEFALGVPSGTVGHSYR